MSARHFGTDGELSGHFGTRLINFLRKLVFLAWMQSKFGCLAVMVSCKATSLEFNLNLFYCVLVR